MPDITMCKGGSCPYKDECHRYRARPTEYRQSYFAKPPMNPPVTYGWGPPHDKYAHCDHFVPIEPGDDLAPKPKEDKPAPYRGFKYL